MRCCDIAIELSGVDITPTTWPPPAAGAAERLVPATEKTRTRLIAVASTAVIAKGNLVTLSLRVVP
jgi:hypothetical protein